MMLEKCNFKHYIENFNKNDEEIFNTYISNESAWTWLKDNIPFFECPDKEIEETYYFRWWTYRKHLKPTPEGFIITEFQPEVPWAGKYNSISAAAPHHFYEGRWLKYSKQFLDDYAEFWFRKTSNTRAYSSWLADAVWNYCMVKGDFRIAVELLPDLAANYNAWEKSNLNGSGLFWSNDDRDAMEFSISGSGIRPTLNSYMYADAIAIAKIAELSAQADIEQEFLKKAYVIKSLLLERLWDESSEFFKAFPLPETNDIVTDWNFSSINPEHNVRELIGFIPWYFNLPDHGYEAAWKQLMSEQGFYTPYGLTTAERSHPGFMFSHDEHECLWNGPSWPFATSQTLTAMANLLINYKQDIVDRYDFFKLMKAYAKCHYRKRNDGSMVSWIDENLQPFTGEWLSRDILEKWNWRTDKGGRERGKDYNHSTFCDLIISCLIGIRPRQDDIIEVNPLIPEGTWDYFCLDNLYYRKKEVTILYDKTGNRYGMGAGLHLYVDGREVAKSTNLSLLKAGF